MKPRTPEIPMPTTEKRTLHAKLAEIMAEADRIPKNGRYTGQGQFAYVLVGDAADAIRKALGERKVSMLPSAVDVVSESEHDTRSGGTMTTLTIRTTWTLVDGESGETATIQSLGTGADAGDKASPKAQTNAMKYALLMGFLLSTGDDPEQVDTSDRQQKAGEETLTLLGPISRSGKIAKGDGRHSNLEAHETPDGHHIGFRLNVGKDAAVPQVCLEGELGRAVFLALGEAGPESLLGKHAKVTGKLYEVRAPQRRSTHRLIAEAIETDDWTIPAPPEPELPVDPAVPVAPGQEALALDEDEKALIASGLPE
jgi:hypothetical protein